MTREELVTRTLELTNTLLEKAGSQERAYTLRDLFGGEDSIAVFLTPDLYGMVQASPLVSEEDKLMTAGEALSASE